MLKVKILNSEIRYSTQTFDTKLKRYDTQSNGTHKNSRYSTKNSQLLMLYRTHFNIKQFFKKDQ